jgi:phosphate starvation-inducible PhoH-like protein
MAKSRAKGKGAAEQSKQSNDVVPFVPKAFRPKTDGQRKLWHELQPEQDNGMVIVLGPAGTGKTYLAVSAAVDALQGGKVKRIILARPAVDAGENLGYLPGALEDKVAPYMQPLYDSLRKRMGPEALKEAREKGIVEIATVAHMRGRTLEDAFIVVDEAQNMTYEQTKMFLTRLGWGSTMVLTGDPAQSDLKPGVSRFAEAVEKLERVSGDGLVIVRLTDADIVRHRLVARVLSVL